MVLSHSSLMKHFKERKLFLVRIFLSKKNVTLTIRKIEDIQVQDKKF